MSWNELAEVSERFYTLGKRYGLLKEFRENGIPCQENHDLQPVNVVEQFTTTINLKYWHNEYKHCALFIH